MKTLNSLQTCIANGEITRLTEGELLGIVLSDLSAGESTVAKFGGFYGIANQPLERFLKVKGLGEAKIIRLTAIFEMALRMSKINIG